MPWGGVPAYGRPSGRLSNKAPDPRLLKNGDDEAGDGCDERTQGDDELNN
jgi:hypothetical protein